MVLNGKTDIFGGITVDASKVSGVGDAETARVELLESLERWKAEGVCGVWFRIDKTLSFWIPVLTAQGFDFHHAQTNYVMLTKWLLDSENTLPRYAFTTVGVGGLVVTSDNRILLMKEKRGSYLGWKFPGGAADPHESIYETAEREVFEETGVAAKANNILCFRHGRSGWEGNMDIYFICIMHPVDESNIEPKPCPRETEACQWVKREEIDEMPWACSFPIKEALRRFDCLRAKPESGCRETTYSAGNKSWQIHYME